MTHAISLWTAPLLAVFATVTVGCGKSAEKPNAHNRHKRGSSKSDVVDREFPLNGKITGVQLVVREKPESESPPLGWLRHDAHIRLKPNAQKSPTCSSGWYSVRPRGWACAGQGIRVSREEIKETDVTLDRNAPLPYSYYYVKEIKVPEYFRLPSRDEQRAATAVTDEYLALRAKNETAAEKFLEGKLARSKEAPSVVRRWLDRGFFLAAIGSEVRASRRFVRTVYGSYVKANHLESRTGSDFRGMDLDEEHTLPVAFAVRSAQPLRKRERADGTIVFIDDPDSEVIERQHVLLNWVGREHVGDEVVHRLENDLFLRAWFVGVAELVPPPPEVKGEETWVHVDLSEQTLVLYRGAKPIFVTLVSTGLPGHETVAGTFRIQKKLVSDTMSALGPDAGEDRYRIEDVPWTQYFRGSMALHGAFWHSGFGIPRSHGCINLSPHDAHRIFTETLPDIPAGWHGVSTQQTPWKGSVVLITP